MFESIFEFDAPGAPALAPAAPQPPPLQDSLSSRLGNNEDLIEEVLKQGDLRMLCQLKGVSQGWRARARRVLWARLCRRVAPWGGSRHGCLFAFGAGEPK